MAEQKKMNLNEDCESSAQSSHQKLKWKGLSLVKHLKLIEKSKAIKSSSDTTLFN